MWSRLKGLFSKESLCDEAFRECLEVLRESYTMVNDAIASLRTEGALEIDIYARDRRINRFERRVRRKIVTHLAISVNPDVISSLVLTSVVIDIERIGDYTKNIVELAAVHDKPFRCGELEEPVRNVEETVKRLLSDLPGALETSDVERARGIIGDHQVLSDQVEDLIEDLITGKTLSQDSGEAVTAGLYLRYLKRVSAHIKNVATSVVNPYYRIGFREKESSGEDPNNAGQ